MVLQLATLHVDTYRLYNTMARLKINTRKNCAETRVLSYKITS